MAKLWIDGKWQGGGSRRDLIAPFDGRKLGQVEQADAAQVESAIQAAVAAFPRLRETSRYLRSRLLSEIAAGIQARKSDLVSVMVGEAGKPRQLAEGEIGRAVNTFTIAAEEAKRFGGQQIPIDIEPAGRAYWPVITQPTPRGPILAIAPFNFPLNLVAHKVAPALAVGAPVVVKPPPQAPGAACILAEVFEAALGRVGDDREKIPPAALQIIHAANDVIAPAVTDPRLPILSFTGSDRVGWMLAEKAYRKKVCLELGGNAAVIVHADADLARAAARCAYGAFAYAGQICISVQRVFVHQSVAREFQDLFLSEIAQLPTGDPAQSDTLVGPMIDAAVADRTLAWIDEAKRAGAKVLAGGTRQGNVLAPTVLTQVKPDQKVCTEEVFAPLAVLVPYADLEDAIQGVNDSRFGLQAGIFTESMKDSRRAMEGMNVGGVIINEVPTYRADNMPYGGVKDSGNCREGVAFAMQEYCDLKTIVQWRG
ncbi:MAG: aldehyde dehydrogenase family protein [Bacteriovoracia bacterium]